MLRLGLGGRSQNEVVAGDHKPQGSDHLGIEALVPGGYGSDSFFLFSVLVSQLLPSSRGHVAPSLVTFLPF